MQWCDIPWQPSPRVLRQFAGLWVVFFGGLAWWHGPVHGHAALGWLLLGLAGGVGLLGLLRPRAVRPVFVTWMVLAFPIGWTVSRLVLLVLFYGLFTPLGLWFRLLGRDPLGLRRPAADTCWLPKPADDDVTRYFRQF